MSEKPLTRCPTCGARATRLISGGGGVIFKGSGFYITDYGRDGKGPRKEPEGAAPAEAKSDQPAKAAPATKPAESAPVKPSKSGGS